MAETTIQVLGPGIGLIIYNFNRLFIPNPIGNQPMSKSLAQSPE
jgi:hypothetical protein